MYSKYIWLGKERYFDFSVGTMNYMAELTVWSPHIIKAFPHVMHILVVRVLLMGTQVIY